MPQIQLSLVKKHERWEAESLRLGSAPASASLVFGLGALLFFVVVGGVVYGPDLMNTKGLFGTSLFLIAYHTVFVFGERCLVPLLLRDRGGGSSAGCRTFGQYSVYFFI